MTVTRTPAKRYEPIWRDKVIGWFFRVFDFFCGPDDPIAPWYLEGPWCAKCGRLWRDKGLWSKRLSCSGCGAKDPAALEAWEKQYRVPADTGELFGIDPFLAMLAAGALLLSRKRSPWWAAFGLESRPESPEDAKRAFKRALGASHPDRGGSREQMEKMRRAWAIAERDYARPTEKATRP